MSEERNNNQQIIRKDAKGCFVEVLNDSFEIGRVHMFFATYDVNKPEGKRQTNSVAIYLPISEVIELCRQASCGELRYLMNEAKKNKSYEPLYQSLGGTSAKKLKKQNKARADGKSLSRTLKILVGDRVDIRLIADSGPGVENEKGLIVPKFGDSPENHVAVSMTFSSLCEMLLISKTHYEAWLAGWYAQNKTDEKGQKKGNQEVEDGDEEPVRYI